MILYHVQCNVVSAFIHNDFDAIVQGCNCFHLMGAGVAKEIAERLPAAVEADKKTEFGDWSKLGTYSEAKTVHGSVINAYTQYRPGKCPPHQLYANIREVMKQINKDFAGKTIGMPKIGAGIAGGDWTTIAEIIQQETPDVKIVVTYL